MGSLKDLMGKLPFFPDGLPDEANLDDRELTKIEAMISSMTVQERKNPSVFVTTSWEEITSNAGKKSKRRRADYDPSRVARISKGSGRDEKEVKELLHKFAMMRQMMVQLGASTGLMGKIPGLKQFSQMKKLAGLDLGALMGGGGGGMPGMAPAGVGAAMPQMQIPGMPSGFTPPGTPGGGARPVKPATKTKAKAKRKAAKKARKKTKKR